MTIFAHLLLTFFTSQAEGSTLQEAYQSALKHRSIITEKRLAIQISKEEKRKVLSAALPSLTLSSSNNWLDEVSGSGVTGQLGKGHQHTGKLSINQTLYNGGSLYHGLNMASQGTKIAILEKKQAELDLYQKIAHDYYGLLTLKQNIAILHERADILSQRVSFLKKRAQIGRSKTLEVITAQSQLVRVQAQTSLTNAKLDVSKRHFEWLTGLENLEPLSDPFEMFPLTIQSQLVKKLDSTPGIQAFKLKIKNANLSIDLAKSSYRPSVDLSGNYYLDRSGVLADSKWDVSLSAKWEIFSGNESQAEVSIQSLKRFQLQANFEDQQKKLKFGYETGLLNLNSKRKSQTQLKRAVEYAHKSYLEHKTEFRKDLISNLDVLRAMDDYLQIKQLYEKEKLDARLEWISLKLLAGVEP